jgi:hypothetical protein
MARSEYPNGMRLQRVADMRRACDPSICEFHHAVGTDVYVCKRHLHVHNCPSTASHTECKFALVTRESIVCSVSARTWPLDLDTLMQRMTQSRSAIADGDDGDDAHGEPSGGDGTGGCADLSADAARLDSSRVIRERPTAMTESGFVTETVACVEGARHVLGMITSSDARQEINRKRTSKSIDKFHMAVRRYAQCMADSNRHVSVYMLMCLFGHSYPDIVRYSGATISKRDETIMCQEAVQLWMRMRSHGFYNTRINTAAPTAGVSTTSRGGQVHDIAPIRCGAAGNAASAYHFSFHCIVVFTHMRTGYSINDKCIVNKHEAASVFPSPRDMHVLGFPEKRITTHMATFACTFASIASFDAEQLSRR